MSGHVRKKHLWLVRANNTVGHPSTIQWAPQSVVIFDVDRVKPGITTNGTKARDKSDRGHIEIRNDHLRTA